VGKRYLKNKKMKKENYLREILTNKNCFDGAFFDFEIDHSRLTKQMGLIFLVILDGKFKSVIQIQEEILNRFYKRCAQTSISAILRDFRKTKWGEHTVNTRRVKDTGLFEYQFIFNSDPVIKEGSGQLKLVI